MKVTIVGINFYFISKRNVILKAYSESMVPIFSVNVKDAKKVLNEELPGKDIKYLPS